MNRSNPARDIITKELLRMENGAFIVRLFLVIGCYVGVTFWLNAIRQTAAIWFVWVLIAVQFFFLISIFVVCSLRAKQCGFQHTWLILVALILSRINNWEVVIIPALVVFMLILSTRNRTVSVEHEHLLPPESEPSETH
jgi:hypothetical protein